MKNIQIAQAFGCSNSYVSRLVKRGMPTDSIEAAKLWRSAHASEGFAHKQRRPVPPDAIAAAVANLARALPPPDSTRAPDDDPLSAVQRARRTEKEIYLLVELATEEARRDRNAAGALPGLLRTAAQANTNRLSAEARYEKQRLEIGEVAPVAELNATLDAALVPLASQLRNFPRNVASAANPANPAAAEKAIADALNSILEQIATALEAKAPGTVESEKQGST